MSADVSVVIPTFDRAERVVEAVRSVLEQTSPPREILVVDDGSTDATEARLAALAALAAFAVPGDPGGPELRFVSAPHRGVSAARNVGIRRARGEWLALLDSDDRWLPEKLEKQLAAIAAEPGAVLCHCDEIWYRRGRRVNPRRIHRKRGGWIYRHCLPRCAISPSSTMLHRRLLDEVGLFDESMPACEDYDLWLRVCARHPVLFVDEPLVVKTGGHADQLSSTVPALDRYRIRALAKILDQDVLGAEERRATLETLREKIDVYGAGAAKRGRHQEVAELRDLARRLAD